MRTLYRRRQAFAFTSLLVLTLALGIGATTAMFSVVDALLINPLPFPNADRIVEIWTTYKVASGSTTRQAGTQAGVAGSLRDAQVFSSLQGYQFGVGTLTGVGEPATVTLPSLSPGIFGLFPVEPRLGRLFNDTDAASGDRVILISERMWMARFGGDANIVGRSLTINDEPHRVIGVLPKRFAFPESTVDVWKPLNMYPPKPIRMTLIGVRRPEMSPVELAARLSSISEGLHESGALPDTQSLDFDLPLQVRFARQSSGALYLMVGAVGVLMLLACVNVSNLMLVRASVRHGELALMSALGASRVDLLRSAVLESLVTAIAACVLGVPIALAFLRAVLALAPRQMTLLSKAPTELDGRSLAFAITLAVVTCVVVGILPAWRVSRTDAIDALKGSARTAIGTRDDWWQGALVSAQIALVVVLLAGAGLLLRSFVRLNEVDLGFDPSHLSAIELQLPAQYAKPGAGVPLLRQIEQRAEAALHASVTVASATPVRPGGFMLGATPEAEGLEPSPVLRLDLPTSRVSPDFFAVMGIPILEGRAFTPDDRDDAIIVNDLLARRFFADVSPIGHRFRLDSDDPWRTVVGVARDIKTMGPADLMGAGLVVYQPLLADRRANFLTLLIATDGNAASTLAAMKQIIWQIDDRIPITTAATMNDQIGEAISRPRFMLGVTGAFAAVGVLLAAIGVYGVSAYWVTRRRREIAIRITLGASRSSVVGLVIGRGLKLAAIGVVAGLGVSLAAGKIIESLLFSTSPRDPVTLVGVAVMLALLAISACALPAWRASRVDPMGTLRAE